MCPFGYPKWCDLISPRHVPRRAVPRLADSLHLVHPLGTTYAYLFALAIVVQLIPTASKEWVIPAKPKPGRKPKRETNTSAIVPKDDIVRHPCQMLAHDLIFSPQDEESSGSRRVQNRQDPSRIPYFRRG